MAKIICNPVDGGQLTVEVEDLILDYPYPPAKCLVIEDEDLEYSYFLVLPGFDGPVEPDLYALTPMAATAEATREMYKEEGNLLESGS